MRFKVTALLLLVALLTGGLYFFYIKPSIEEKRRVEEFEKRFFRADIDGILLFKVDRGRGPVEVIKTKEGWVMTGNLKVDPGVMRKFLSTLSKGRLIKVVGDKEEKAKFGLDRPKVRIAIGFKDRVEVLLLGDKSPSGKGYYAYAESLGRVFLINREVAEGLAIDPYKLVEKRVFHIDPAQVGRIRIERTKSADRVELVLDRDGKWKMLSPFKGPADNDAVRALISEIYLLKTRSFTEWKDEDMKLPWRAHMEIYDTKGNLIESADVAYRGNEWYKGVVVRTRNSPVTFRVRREFWNSINRRAGFFYKRDLFDFSMDELKRIEVVSEKKRYVISKKSDRWFVNEKPVSEADIEQLVKLFNRWNASIVVSDRDFSGKLLYSFKVQTTRGTQSLKVYDKSKDYAVSETKVFAPVKPGSPRTERVYFWLSSSTEVDQSVVVSSLGIKSIIQTIEEINGKTP